MSGTKFKKINTCGVPALAVLALSLMTTVAVAQTPAQDAATVTTDKQALEDARNNIHADQLQLDLDEKSGNTAAAQADTNKLIADKQAESDIKDKLKADGQDLNTDSSDH